MYKILAFDLDETLFNSSHGLDEGNIIALKKAKEKGCHLVPCSGRGPHTLGSLYQDLDIFSEGNYSILCNGSIIIDNKTDEIIAHHSLTFEEMEELFWIGRKENLSVEIFTPDAVYIYYTDDLERQRVSSFGDSIKFLEHDDISFLKDKILLKIIFQRDNSYDFFYDLATRIPSHITDYASITYSSFRYMEFNPLGIHKGTGLLELANYLNVPIEETIGVGDNHNDLELVQDAGLGLAVHNAIQEIKDAADVVLDRTNNENAIAEVVERYIL